MIGPAGRITWEQIDIRAKIFALAERVTCDLKETPAQNTRTLRKLKKWMENLQYILDSIDRITETFGDRLDRILNTNIKQEELLIIAMFQPSTKNLFMELEIHFRDQLDSPISGNAFANLIGLSEMGRVLAILGDAVIDMAVLHHLWKGRAADAGKLTQQRSTLVSNENMAKISDQWGLFSRRVHFDPPTTTRSEIEHIKGTLLEALYGVIYILYGFEKIVELVKFLK